MSNKSTEDAFFEGKRPWSVVKDQVIGCYVRPFTRKVAQFNRPILIIDAFAGPGVFEDGSAGSPLIICNSASGVNAPWQAIFINRSKQHHDRLRSILEKGNWLFHAFPHLGDSTEFLRGRVNNLTDEIVFLYLDPFGLKGFEFRTIIPYLERERLGHRVELVVNMSMPTLHRLAAFQAIKEGKQEDPQVRALNQILSNALNGNWWQEIMWAEAAPHVKEAAVMERFAERLGDYLPYTGYCPVRESADAAVKYYITFASGHPDALEIMNDCMVHAYEKYIFAAQAGGQQSLWGWKTGRDLSSLETTILQTVGEYRNQTRDAIWISIIRSNFMKWLKSDYHDTLKTLSEQKRIVYPIDPKTRRRNHNSILSLPTSSA
jgi:three-Cys-motif partner protein